MAPVTSLVGLGDLLKGSWREQTWTPTHGREHPRLAPKGRLRAAGPRAACCQPHPVRSSGPRLSSRGLGRIPASGGIRLLRVGRCISRV